MFFCALTLFQGILGSVQSGKSALVHRYLTGSYMQEESPEGTSLHFTASSVCMYVHHCHDSLCVCVCVHKHVHVLLCISHCGCVTVSVCVCVCAGLNVVSLTVDLLLKDEFVKFCKALTK